MRIQVWHGWRAVHNGKDVSRWEWVEFDGEPLGSLVVEVDENRTDERVFYRLYDVSVLYSEPKIPQC